MICIDQVAKLAKVMLGMIGLFLNIIEMGMLELLPQVWKWVLYTFLGFRQVGVLIGIMFGFLLVSTRMG